jgi:hypothetical protein
MSKINFGNIKGMLSRDEMRQVKGGSGGGCAIFVRYDNGPMFGLLVHILWLALKNTMQLMEI